MNTSDFETRAIVRPERNKHIVAAIGCGAIGLTFLITAITEKMAYPDFKHGVIPSNVISKFDYPQLFENIEFYSNT